MSFSGTTSSDKATDLGKNNARTYKDDYNDLTFSLDDFKLEQREILDLDSQRTSVTLTASVWQELGALWKCSSNEDMKKMKIKVISYCCVNGSSPYMDGDVEVAGKLRPIKDLLVILGAKQHTLRQFMRANADLAAAIMQANPGLSSTVARKKAIDSTFATFAADFMDCREDLKVGTDAYNEVMRSRTRALKGAVNDFENTREYISQSIPKTQGHNDVKNQRTFF